MTPLGVVNTRSSVLSGARGAVSSALNIAYATQTSTPGAFSNTGITLDGVSIAMVGGYPQGWPAASYLSGIYTAAGLSSADYSIVGGAAAGLGASTTITVANADCGMESVRLIGVTTEPYTIITCTQ